MAAERKRFIYEIAPDVFGSELTLEEMEYWNAFDFMRAAEMYGIEWYGYGLEEVKEQIEVAKKKRESKFAEMANK